MEPFKVRRALFARLAELLRLKAAPELTLTLPAARDPFATVVPEVADTVPAPRFAEMVPPCSV
jgi:hypothetical protein